jgi:hypothetical protein
MTNNGNILPKLYLESLFPIILGMVRYFMRELNAQTRE